MRVHWVLFFRNMEKTRDVNKKIHDCIFNLRTKVTDALNKDIHYAKVNGVEDASLKLINCLVEHEVNIVVTKLRMTYMYPLPHKSYC